MLTLSSKNHWLITGGAGFIGSHLVRELVRQNQQVTVLDNLSNATLAQLADVKEKISFLQADICDKTALEQACAGVDYVLHEAALVSVPVCIKKPQETLKVNFEGTRLLLQVAAACGVKRLVFASSAAVYGARPELPYLENTPTDCQSPYAQAKYLAEQSCLTCKGLETVVLRYFNVFGPGQNPHCAYAAVIAKFMQLAAENKPLCMEWDGLQSRDFVYVTEVVAANLLAATNGVAGEIYNVASGKTYTLLELADTIEKVSGRKLGRIFRPKRLGDVRQSSADITKIKQLGYSPSVTLEEGLRILWQIQKGK